MEKSSMITIRGMSEIVDCFHCRFCIYQGGHPWCVAQCVGKIHYIDLSRKEGLSPGFREESCPLVKGPGEAQWKWAHVSETYKCTNCNFEVCESDEMPIEDYNYCPRCGALIDYIIYETE